MGDGGSGSGVPVSGAAPVSFRDAVKSGRARRSRRGHLACNAAEDTCKPVRMLPPDVCQRCIIISYSDWFTVLGGGIRGGGEKRMRTHSE